MKRMDGEMLITCRHVKESGDRCRAKPMRGGDFCFFHNPDTAAKRRAAQREGGRSRATTVLSPETTDMRLGSIEDVATLLGKTINQVRKGQIDPRVSNAVGYLAGIMLKALGQGELEKRLVELEAVVRSQSYDAGSVFGQDTEDAEPSPLRAVQ